MKYTTDPAQAIQSLLSSPESDPVISFDGTTYRVSDASDQKKGFFQILTRDQVAPLLKNPVRLGKWLASHAEEWFRSARLTASLAEES